MWVAKARFNSCVTHLIYGFDSQRCLLVSPNPNHPIAVWCDPKVREQTPQVTEQFSLPRGDELGCALNFAQVGRETSKPEQPFRKSLLPFGQQLPSRPGPWRSAACLASSQASAPSGLRQAPSLAHQRPF